MRMRIDDNKMWEAWKYDKFHKTIDLPTYISPLGENHHE